MTKAADVVGPISLTVLVTAGLNVKVSAKLPVLSPVCPPPFRHPRWPTETSSR